MNEAYEEGSEEQCKRHKRGEEAKNYEGVYEEHVRLLFEVREMRNEICIACEECGE